MKAKLLITAFLLLIFCFFSCGNDNSKIKTELYFGLSNANGAIPKNEWNQFQTETIDKVIDGYTIINGEGYWKANDSTYNEKTVILIYIHDDTTAESKKIDSLINIYKQKFSQESVLRTDQQLKAAF
jgi:hypothetical protein